MESWNSTCAREQGTERYRQIGNDKMIQSTSFGRRGGVWECDSIDQTHRFVGPNLASLSSVEDRIGTEVGVEVLCVIYVLFLKYDSWSCPVLHTRLTLFVETPRYFTANLSNFCGQNIRNKDFTNLSRQRKTGMKKKRNNIYERRIKIALLNYNLSRTTKTLGLSSEQSFG